MQVDFPAVTICSTGRTQSNLEAAFYNLFYNFLHSNNVTVPYTSLDLWVALQEVATFALCMVLSIYAL